MHGVGHDAQGVRRDELLEPLQEVVVVVSVLEGGEQRQPGDREGGHGGLADALRQGDGLLGAAAHGDVVSGQEVPEAEPLQAVDDRRDGTGLPGPRQGVGVEVLLRRVVTQLQGGVAEVPQHVAVVHLLADVPGPGPAPRRPRTSSPSATWVMATNMCLRHSVRGESPGGRVPRDVDGRQRGTAVGAVRAHHGCRDADLQRSVRVEPVDRVRGLDEDPVGLGGRPEVDLDVSAQARDVAEQQRVGGLFTGRGQQGLRCAGPAARPGAAGGREGEPGTLRRIGGQRRRPLVGRERRDVPAATQCP